MSYGSGTKSTGTPVFTGKERHFSRCWSYIECFLNFLPSKNITYDKSIVTYLAGNVSSQEKLSTSRSREADVSVSAIYVSCPKPIFGQIVQATVRSVNGL